MCPGGGPFAPKPAGKIDQPICINTTSALAHFFNRFKTKLKYICGTLGPVAHRSPHPPPAPPPTPEAAEAEAAGFEAAEAKAIDFQISTHCQNKKNTYAIFEKKGVE